MSDKDPRPFGYTFSDDFFPPGVSAAFDAPGQSLLNDVENQSLADFFSNTDPFHLSDPHAFPTALDAKDGLYDYHDTWGGFIAPATVHRVTTTVPDQPHLQHGFHPEPAFMPSVHVDHLGNTPDDLQAASTLFNNTQPSYSNGPSRSYLPPPAPGPSSRTNSVASANPTQHPMVVTPHGHLNEQLAALLPHHAQDGTLDAQLAAHWAATSTQQQIQQHKAKYSPLLQKPTFKRSYTFGTDSSFNDPGGFSGEHSHEPDSLHSRQSKHDMEHSDFLIRSIVGVPEPVTSPTGPTHLPLTQGNAQSDDDKSDDATSEDESSDRPAKKRRKSKYKVGKDSVRNGTRNGKGRRTSLIEDSNKKKRASAAAQKLQRENLTEEQKRNNHILSEQKRRNLIKRGFDDLHDLVPEIRNGGLSKSSVLMEAGNFLEKLIHDNNSFWQLAGSISLA